jgi:hypothetical protein
VNYPQRAYIPRTGEKRMPHFSYKQWHHVLPVHHTSPLDFPGGLNNNFFHHKYQLPAGLTGDLVLLQWHWVSRCHIFEFVKTHSIGLNAIALVS